VRIPFSWLKDFVEIPDSPEETAEKLRRVGVPVDRVEVLSPGISRVFSGKIEVFQPHPNAEKLRIAQVNMGNEMLQIITGASNVKQGDIVPVARIGAVLASGKTIQEAKLRGIPSFGMMCSADELALGIKEFLPPEQQNGVMVLDPDTPIGIDLSSMLGLNEAVLVLEPFANRPDYLSVFGIARELSAIYKTPLKFPELAPDPQGNLKEIIHVEIQDAQSCSRYIARYIYGVKVKPSPIWMSVRLFAAGMRPINNIVDITNYVLLELGQPLHAFDYCKIFGKKILVRKALDGETLKAIDEKEYSLSENMLVIADSEKPIALAGIMGGKESEVQEDTSEILLESAHFDPGTIRRASIRLGLRTESSRRFEKGLDMLSADWGSRRACQFFSRLGAQVAPGAEDISTKPKMRREVAVSLSHVQKFLGVEKLDAKEVEHVLKSLGFEVLNNDPFLVQSPHFRCDIHEEMDVVEEIARHYGYDRIPATLPSGITTPAKLDRAEAFERKMRGFLQNLGLFEVISLSLGDPSFYEKLHLRSFAFIQNPLTEDRKALRPLLYPGLLLTAKKNLAVKNKDLALFELGKVFKKREEISEKRHFCILLSGKLPWGKDADFASAKGMLEAIWQRLHIREMFELKGESRPAFHPHRFVVVLHNEKSIGFMGEIHPFVLELLEIKQPVVVLELSLDQLQILENPTPKFKPLPLFPESQRDISMIVDEKLPAGEIVNLVKSQGENLVEEVRVFDVYQKPPISQGKKSIAISVVYRHAEKTLTDQEVNAIHDKILQLLENRYSAVIRK
jgi:phenylalanyl-tRNA synthetase beta chain